MQISFPESDTLTVTPDPLMSDDQFFDFCLKNPDLRIERTEQGEIVIMPPTGGEPSHQNSLITAQLTDWSRRDGRGVAFDSSCGFILPSGAVRSPDAAWVRKSWLAELPKDRKRRHLPLCPDFLIELMSPSDRRSTVLAKMREWIENGAELAWIIDPESSTVTIHRPGRDPEELVNPSHIDGEGPIQGFRLDMSEIWAGL